MSEDKPTLLERIDSISSGVDKAIEQVVLRNLQHGQELAAAHRRGWDQARESAARVLGAEVERHEAETPVHGFCEEYGCSSLVKYMQEIRALPYPGAK